MKTPAEILMPASLLMKLNINIPTGVKVELQLSGGINSPNEAGGYVPPDRFTNNQK